MTRSLTSAERVLHALRELILGGELAPGARLGEVELADRLGVSRTPVREALTRLAAEGMVEIQPNRGARVATWTVAELEGVFDLRISAGTPAHRATPSRTPGPPTSRSSTTSRTAWSRSAAPAPARTSTRSSRSTAPSTTGWSRWPPTPRWPPRWPRRSTRRSCAGTSPPTTRSRCAAASPTTLEIVAAVRAGDPGWARAVMTAHISNARAVMVRAATAGTPQDRQR